jgi:hypothetical protein
LSYTLLVGVPEIQVAIVVGAGRAQHWIPSELAAIFPGYLERDARLLHLAERESLFGRAGAAANALRRHVVASTSETLSPTSTFAARGVHFGA